MMDGDSEKNRYSSSNFEEEDMMQQQEMGTGGMDDMNENYLDPMEAIEEEEETLGANPT